MPGRRRNLQTRERTMTQSIIYRQANGTDWVEISFSADGEDLQFIPYIDCGGLPCREVITRDARYHYIYGRAAEGPALTASLRGEGATYRHAFETVKGRAQIILAFHPDAAGDALRITHALPGAAPLVRDFIRERAAVKKAA